MGLAQVMVEYHSMSERMDPKMDSLDELKRTWVFMLGLAALGLFTGATVLGVAWFTVSSLGVVFLALRLRQHLALNYRPHEQTLLAGFGPGTLLTISRGYLIALLAGFLALPQPSGALAWFPAGLYALAVIADYLDGYLARVTDRVTVLGAWLDMQLDGLGVLVAALLAVAYGQVPAIYLAVGLARYVYLAVVWFRERTGRPVFELPPSVRRRAFAGMQMGFIAVMLMPLFSPPGTHVVANLYMLIFLAGFAYDGLIASDVIHPQAAPPANGLTRWLNSLAPLLFRVLSLSLLAAVALDGVDARGVLDASSAALSHWADRPGWLALIGLEALIFLMLLTGSAGRVAALAALLLMGFIQMTSALSVTQLGLLASATVVFFMGTGPLSLWTPEERLVRFRAGARR